MRLITPLHNPTEILPLPVKVSNLSEGLLRMRLEIQFPVPHSSAECHFSAQKEPPVRRTAPPCGFWRSVAEPWRTRKAQQRNWFRAKGLEAVQRVLLTGQDGRCVMYE